MHTRAALTGLLLLAAFLALPCRAAASDRIAFVTDRDGDTEIYVMDAQGGGLTNLTDGAYDDHAPAWSPRAQAGTAVQATSWARIKTLAWPAGLLDTAALSA